MRVVTHRTLSLLLLVGLYLASGCWRTAFAPALLASQEACADLYRACGEAAKLGSACPAPLPRCPMTSSTKTKYEGILRDLLVGPPLQEERR